MSGQQIILLGGAPTVGKSTIARQLAQELRLPWISTDQIRDIMWAATEAIGKSFSIFHEYDGAEDFLTKYSVEEIVDITITQAKAVWPGIVSMTKNTGDWNSGMIIEGVDILPEFVSREDWSNKLVQGIFLVENSTERIKETVYTRGVWDAAHKYSDHVKPKEVDWVCKFNEYIRNSAGDYDCYLVEVDKSGGDFEKVRNALRKEDIL